MTQPGWRGARRKLVLATAGTQGDLNPFIAIGLALQARGFAPVLAVPRDQTDKVRAAGLDAAGVLPGFDEIRERLGLGDEEAVRHLMADQREMLDQVFPDLSSSARALADLAADAEAVIASIFVLAAPLVAEKLHLPLVSVVLQPMAMLSAADPPATPEFRLLQPRPAGRAGRGWNRLVYAGMRQALSAAYARQFNAVRAEHGLRRARATRMFEPHGQAALTLGCYSAYFAPPPADAPDRAKVVGFPVFDSASGLDEALSPALARFLDDGPPPLVFTLGTFAVRGAGAFYDQAAAVAARLGLRAVLLTGGEGAGMAEAGVFRAGYAPHSLLFPRASAIIHHGGIGTTGQALRAGKPQLVVPHMGDQHDHADRVTRLGVGVSLRAEEFDVERASPLVDRLLREPGIEQEARRIGALIAAERGAERAADAIEAALARAPR